MKKGTITKLVFLSAMTLGVVSCNTHPNTPDPIVEEDYKIMVTAPSGVEYTISHERAKKDEEVTLVITNLSSGFSIRSVVLNGKTTLEAESDGVTYKFNMPNTSASIVITLDVDGDIVISGDVSAKLELTSTPGLYVARNVRLDGKSSASKLSYYVKKDGVQTKLNALDLDETKSFGSIGITGSKTDEALEIENGDSYDFYYDSNSSEAPCYIQRVGVNDLPTDSEGLQRLLITKPSVRSEYSVYTPDYVGCHYKVKDLSGSEIVTHEYDWKLYENNMSFAYVNDYLEDEGDYSYIYKKYDEDSGLYTVVDTYSKYFGDTVVNDDRYRLAYNDNGPVSAQLGVIDGDDYAHRYEVSARHANRNVRTSAHMPHFFVEREFWYAYRSSFSTDSGVTSYNIDIQSEAKADGFDVTLVSYKEFGYSAGIASGSKQEAYTYNATFSFKTNGALKDINYKEIRFSDTEWDFSTHAPKTGIKGSTRKTINASYTYGNAYTGAPDYKGFNASDYFITSFNDLRFINENREDAKDDGKSYVGITDDIYLTDLIYYNYNPLLANKKCFAPATALDLWQYGPVESSNPSVITRDPTNAPNEMRAINEGTSTLTFTNHVPGTGISHDIVVDVKATSLVREFCLYEGAGYDHITSVTSATIKAGGVYNFKVGAFPHESALAYHAVSENTSLLKVTSPDNSERLTIDVTKANITKATNVKVTMEANYKSYEYNGQTIYYGPTVFTFTILPADINPVGTWTGAHPDLADTHFYFTNEDYTGTVAPGYEGAKKGSLVDTINDSGTLLTDRWNFYYTFNNGNLKVVFTSCEIHTMSGSFSPSDFIIDFYYDAMNEYYYVFMAYVDRSEEDPYYYVILGAMADDSMQGYDIDVVKYSPFTRTSK